MGSVLAESKVSPIFLKQLCLSFFCKDSKLHKNLIKIHNTCAKDIARSYLVKPKMITKGVKNVPLKKKIGTDCVTR